MKRLVMCLLIVLCLTFVFGAPGEENTGVLEESTDTISEAASETDNRSVTAYFASRTFDQMQIDSSLILASPFEDCIAISIRLSYPIGFPNTDIACFRAYLNDTSYDLEYNEDIPMPWTAPSVFCGMIPFGDHPEELRIVPVAMGQEWEGENEVTVMEEMSDCEITFSDYQKME